MSPFYNQEAEAGLVKELNIDPGSRAPETTALPPPPEGLLPKNSDHTWAFPNSTIALVTTSLLRTYYVLCRC